MVTPTSFLLNPTKSKLTWVIRNNNFSKKEPLRTLHERQRTGTSRRTCFFFLFFYLISFFGVSGISRTFDDDDAADDEDVVVVVVVGSDRRSLGIEKVPKEKKNTRERERGRKISVGNFLL